MRHHFLLDENILYHAIRGVDRHYLRDDTAARLIQTIVEVCHSLVIHGDIMAKYLKIIERLRQDRSSYSQPVDFIKQLLFRADKRTLHYQELPKIPAGCNIPREDEYIVQAALIIQPLLVTADEPLYDALKKHPELGIEVLWPHEALERAKESPED